MPLQEMAAGLKCNRKIHLMDMLPFLFFKCDLTCYVRAEIKKNKPRPYLMCDHLPAFTWKFTAAIACFSVQNEVSMPHLRRYISLISSAWNPLSAMNIGIVPLLGL